MAEADEKQQADDERQMIDAAQDVLHAEQGVSSKDLAQPATVVG